ncbi:MAG: DUF4180 domain-containing protein [Anaerolineae bacterium]
MHLYIMDQNGRQFAEAADRDPIRNTAEANDVLSFCFEHGTDRLLLYAENLPTGFFDLSTGAAGALLQRFRQYGLRVAVVWSPDVVKPTARFAEMVAEENRGPFFRMYEERGAAEAWLLSS